MHYDVVLFDLPGTMGSDGVIATISALDYLFVPIKADRLVLESTLNFATTVNDRLIRTGISNLKALCMFWNMVDRRERTVLYDIYQQGFSLLGLDCLQTRVPVRSNFTKDLSTTGARFTGAPCLHRMRALRRSAALMRLWMKSCGQSKLYSHGKENEWTESGG